MDGRSALLLGILGMLALALAAPSLTAPVALEPDDQEAIEPEFEEESGADVEIEEPADTGGEADSYPIFFLFLLVPLAFLGALLRTRPVEAGKLLVAGVVLVLGGGGVALAVGATAGFDQVDDGVSETASLLLVATALSLAVGGAALIHHRTGSGGIDERAIDAGETTTGSVEPTDQSEECPVWTVGADENDVYRAWNEMVEALDGPVAATKTPGEIEVMAVRAGYDPDRVRSLTRLFESVRYGTGDDHDVGRSAASGSGSWDRSPGKR